jgi:hypothetical protein
MQSERVEIAKQIEEELGERRGRPSKENTENFLELNHDKGEDTRQIAAKKAGFGNETTYRQARKVVEEGTPESIMSGYLHTTASVV